MALETRGATLPEKMHSPFTVRTMCQRSALRDRMNGECMPFATQATKARRRPDLEGGREVLLALHEAGKDGLRRQLAVQLIGPLRKECAQSAPAARCTRSMLNAQCSTLNAKCPMLNAQRSMLC